MITKQSERIQSLTIECMLSTKRTPGVVTLLNQGEACHQNAHSIMLCVTIVSYSKHVCEVVINLRLLVPICD